MEGAEGRYFYRQKTNKCSISNKAINISYLLLYAMKDKYNK